MGKLKTGDKAPAFRIKNQEGKTISSEQFKGKKLLLYFYPKDDTSGCTAEACNLRDHYDELRQRGYEILGVSIDDEKSHMKFISKYSLPFDLLADTGRELVNAYGVWGEKKMYGKSYMGTVRTSFLINEEGIIENIIEKVDTKNHAAQILG